MNRHVFTFVYHDQYDIWGVQLNGRPFARGCNGETPRELAATFAGSERVLAEALGREFVIQFPEEGNKGI